MPDVKTASTEQSTSLFKVRLCRAIDEFAAVYVIAESQEKAEEIAASDSDDILNDEDWGDIVVLSGNDVNEVYEVTEDDYDVRLGMIEAGTVIQRAEWTDD